jgi:DNA-binding CsgD family transcriptional regulator
MMFIERRASAWRTIEVDGDAWHREDTPWDRDVLFALLEASGVVASSFPSATTLVRRIVPSAHLRSVETVGTSGRRSLRRGESETTDVELLGWAVSLLWGNDTVGSALAEGVPVARYRVIDGMTDVHVCLPVSPASTPLEVVAVSLVAMDAQDALMWVSRLTLVRHLWTTAGHETADFDVAEDVRADEAAGLTARQQFILEAMSQGLTNGQIARTISFSESTVRVESMAIYRHFGVHSRHEAVVAARLRGDLPESRDALPTTAPGL